MGGSVEADQDGIHQAAALRHSPGLGPVCFLWNPARASESPGSQQQPAASSCASQRSSCPCATSTSEAAASTPTSADSTNNPEIPAEASNQHGSDSEFRIPVCSHFLPPVDQTSPPRQERSPRVGRTC